MPLSVPQLLPPSDLLGQVQGIEDGLIRRRRLQWLGVLLAAVQATVLVVNHGWVQALLTANWDEVKQQWWLIAIVFVLVLSVLLVSWTRFWLNESKTPFRYTFAISPFEPVTKEDSDPRMPPLQTDLLEKLSRRVGRLSRLVEDETKVGAEAQPVKSEGSDGAEPLNSSHIHVSGYYAKRRRRPDRHRAVEVTAWVRIGDPGRPATLAPPVKYLIRTEGDKPPMLDDDQYEEVLERAYSSVATAIYNQIHQDVARKISLLPSRYFRAAAYYYEAQDYARSNTLDAYDRALELFDAALKVYDPNWKPVPRARMRRPLRKLRQILAGKFQRVRRYASHGVARLGKSEVLAARAQISYANTLLYRRILASLAGGGFYPIFEALPIVDRAVTRLEQLADDVPGQHETLFDAYVAQALAYTALNRSDKAEEGLAKARAHAPYRAERDARLLFVSGWLEVDVLTALPRLRRAVEFDPHFEAAQFQLAYNLEMLWRLRPGLEENVAEMVFEEYESVVRLNPGNVAAWANLGYMHWMLAGFEQRKGAEPVPHADLSRAAFESGRQYKDIKREVFVGELDHGLARLAAEAGNFKQAYRHYVNTVAAIMTQGRSQAQETYRTYQLSLISEKMLGRFADYLEAVRGAWKNPKPLEKATTTERVRDSVYAFALNDFAEASYHYYLRSGDLMALDRAHDALHEATEELRTSYILAYLNLARVERERAVALQFFADDDPGGSYLDYVDKVEPSWAEGNLLTLVRSTERAKAAKEQAEEARRKAGEIRQQAHETVAEAVVALQDAQVAVASPWMAESGMAETEYVAGPESEGLPEAKLDALEAEARELDRQAEDLEALARKKEQRARQLTRSLLPHQWLWKPDAVACENPDDIPEAELDAGALRRKDYQRELKWERSFDDFHVRALVSWCERRQLAGDGDRHDQRSVQDVLDLIEERFAPGSAEVLMKRRVIENVAPQAPQRSPSKLSEKDRERAIREILLRDHRSDRYAYWTLARLQDPAIEPEDRQKIYADAACQSGRPPTLYRWLGDRLREAGDGDTAKEAYKRAAETDHPLTLYELAQQFLALAKQGQDPQMHGEALKCLRKAAAARTADAAVLYLAAGSLSELGAVDEAVRCLDQAARATEEPSLLSSIAGQYESAGLWGKCAGAYRRAAEHDAERTERTHSDGFYRLGMGRALLYLGHAREAVAELAHVRGDDEVGPHWRTDLVDKFVSAKRVSRPAYFLLHALLLADQRMDGRPEDVADASAALLALARSAEPLQGTDASVFAETDIPACLPIVLVADRRRFFKHFGDTPEVARLIDTDIPAIQERVLAERGVYMPGVRIMAAEDFAQREYRLLIHEVELERGKVPRGAADPHAYMLDRLERLVWPNLAAFVDAESVERLLQEWQNAAYFDRGALRMRVLASNDSLRRFVQLIEALVREAVPLGDIGAIVSQFGERDRDLASIALHEAVDEVRHAARASLPGADRRQIVPLPPDVEAGLRSALDRHGGAGVVLPRGELERLRELVRDAVAEQGSEPFAFEVQDVALRFFANRLVELDHPELPVLSARETEERRVHAFLAASGLARFSPSHPQQVHA